MEEHFNALNSESLKVGLKIHKGKTKYMIKHADNEDIIPDQEKSGEKKRQNSNTSDKPHTSKTLQKKKSMLGSEQYGAVLEILQDRKLTILLKKRSNGPVCLANKDLWLPSSVSQ